MEQPQDRPNRMKKIFGFQMLEEGEPKIKILSQGPVLGCSSPTYNLFERWFYEV